LKVAIQGELGSNSHMATVEMIGNRNGLEIIACTVSAQALAKVVEGQVDAAVLPIENSLHGSVAEHYDLLLELPVRIDGESLLRIRHNVIAMPGVKLAEVRKIMSHPVALSQCRRFLAAHPDIEVVPFYDTAGSVKHLMGAGLREVAGIAPELAAREYGGEVLVPGVEDHAENYTRFHLLRRADAIFIEELRRHDLYDKVSQAFAVFLPVRSVGVMGDGRRYDYVVALRAVETIDFMTARWARLPYEFLDRVAHRVINEVPGISRVVYDISGKPPATIEWE